MIVIDKSNIDEQKIREIYREFVLGEVRKRIVLHLQAQYQGDANKIVSAFLQSQFGNNPNDITEDAIEDYLFGGDIDAIVLAFWRCVSDVWTRKEQMLELSESSVEKLSRWNGVRERALEEKDVVKRITLIKDVISKATLPFFLGIAESDIDGLKKRGTVISNLSKLEKVKLKYSDDLYHEKQGALVILSDIFSYDLLDGDPRHKLLTAMNIPVCPYCNRQYITHYQDAGKDKITADLDHFYCKSKYSYLALSLYNFVPSCQICNSRFKLARDFYGTPHLYPYEQNPTSGMRFTIADAHVLMDEEAWKDMTAPVVEIKTTGEAAVNSAQTFHLKDVYQSHGDYVQEIIWKAKIYSEDKIKSLYNEFSDVFANEEEVRNLVFGQYLEEKEAHKRPLAKLTQDILEECGVLK
jgi:hypothetical protein